MESTLYNQEGKEVGKVKLPEGIFGLPWNADLVHQVATALAANKRRPTAQVKDRGAVRGGGKKPWRQKGTGRARHGSIRSPLWVGGGVTHGPTNEKVYARKINKKMGWKALATVLSRKFKDGEIFFVDKIVLAEPKTREAKKVFDAFAAASGLESLARKKNNALRILVPGNDRNLIRSFRNLRMLSLGELRNANALDLLSSKYAAIVGPKEALAFLEKRAAK